MSKQDKCGSSLSVHEPVFLLFCFHAVRSNYEKQKKGEMLIQNNTKQNALRKHQFLDINC